MDKQTQATSNDLGTLGEDARALMAATADAVEEKVGQTRNRLGAALERGTKLYGRVREKTVEGVKATDDAMHVHPYHAIGIAFGVGAIIAYLAARRWSHNGA